ncbi:MAG: MGMT family protein [Granulosicoccaceae bacterium]
MNYAHPPNRQLYYEQVWALVREIPNGRVATYGQIAKLLSLPKGVSDDDYKMSASRWVGLAMAACSDDVPWQRVVNTQGKISHPEAAKQKKRLEEEGVLFSKDKLNLDEYQWRGPGENDEPMQGRLF